MQNKSMLLWGMLLIALGAMFLIGNLTGIQVWAICWPTGLILLGVWTIARPYTIGPDTAIEQRILGDIKKRGDWQVRDKEFWMGVGDIDLDLTNAEIPPGETRLRCFGFVGSVKMLIPENAGVSIASTALLTDGKVLGQRQERFVTSLNVTSDDYEVAERKIKIETTYLVVDLKVRRV